MTFPVESAPPSGSRALLRKLGEGDLFLLRWALLGVIAPGCVVALQLTDFFERCDEQQLRILAGHPFYISAEDVQVTTLPAGHFCYLRRHRSVSRRGAFTLPELRSP